MIRHDTNRIDTKRRATIDHKKKQFASAPYTHQEYPHRLNIYQVPPTAEIGLEEFERWAIDRLRVLAELEACTFRNRTPAETLDHIKPLLDKWLRLDSNSSSAQGCTDPRLHDQRRKDHYSHFILRLAFSSTEDLRRRFARVEELLFRLRFQAENAQERQDFVASLSFGWETVQEHETRAFAQEFLNATPNLKKSDLEDGSWVKVDFHTVPELIEGRRVFVKAGKAYVPSKEQKSIVLAGFHDRLEQGLELTARALPRLDEDERLSPILDHLSKNFATPDSSLADSDTTLPGAPITASSVDHISQHFPPCMRNLHINLRKNKHLKHFGRLQYTLFLKGLGLTMEDCLIFWRQSFKLITDDTFNKEYRYNIRHAYGDVGGDAIRRGRGYSPFSCQKILTEHPPGSGESHGCPYRHFSVDNLFSLLQNIGVSDWEVLRGVKDDVEKKRYHIACNRVFEWAHTSELQQAKADNSLKATGLDTIVHPNTYFKRSYLLKSGLNRETGPMQGDHMEM
ncbi:MAG: hypothetical protein L6R35_001322 [Caloplaca aegaea]|nr:MAG: hypothetical protein L6R35_001322 [Caloplaca aegaea]